MQFTRASLLGTGLICVLLSSGPTAGDPDRCADLGYPAWADWAHSFESLNPGVRHIELFSPERDRLLDAFDCAGGGRFCPPDHVFVFYCVDRSFVVFTFEQFGCITFARQLPKAEFLSIVGGAMTC